MVKKPAAAKHPAKSQPKPDRPFAPGYGIVGPADGKGLLPWAWVARKMNRCRTFWLATIHAGRPRPHVMPVWGVWLDDAFFFSTGSKSRKGQNLAVNPACTVANDNGKEAVIIEGRAAQVEDAAVLERVAVAYEKNTKWTRAAWENQCLWCVRALCLDSSRRVFRSRRHGGNCNAGFGRVVSAIAMLRQSTPSMV